MQQQTLTIEQVRKLTQHPRKRSSRTRLTKRQYLERFLATPPAPMQTDAERSGRRSLFEKHDQVVVSLRLPLAPSTNHYWRSWVRPGSTRVMTHVSSEGQAYKAAVAAAWRAHWKGWTPEPLTGRLRLLISVSYFTCAKIDLDNRIKPLQDALTECGVWADDSQIDDLRAIRGTVVEKPGYMDVTIETIGS